MSFHLYYFSFNVPVSNLKSLWSSEFGGLNYSKLLKHHSNSFFSSSRCFGMRTGSTVLCEGNSAPEFLPGNQRTWTHLFPSMGIPPETADSASQRSSRPSKILSKISPNSEVLKIKNTLHHCLIFIFRDSIHKRKVFFLYSLGSEFKVIQKNLMLSEQIFFSNF